MFRRCETDIDETTASSIAFTIDETRRCDLMLAKLPYGLGVLAKLPYGIGAMVGDELHRFTLEGSNSR